MSIGEDFFINESNIFIYIKFYLIYKKLKFQIAETPINKIKNNLRDHTFSLSEFYTIYSKQYIIMSANQTYISNTLNKLSTQSFGMKIDSILKTSGRNVLVSVALLDGFFPEDKPSTLTEIEQEIVHTMRKSLRSKEIARIVVHFNHIESRRWYKKDPNVQALLLKVVRRGLGQLVKIVPGSKITAQSFTEHLEQLLRSQGFGFAIMRDRIYDFELLEANPEFMMNLDLQNKLFDVANSGLGLHVNVRDDYLVGHVKQILAGTTQPMNPWLIH
jgi:hypothetical protein